MILSILDSFTAGLGAPNNTIIIEFNVSKINRQLFQSVEFNFLNESTKLYCLAPEILVQSHSSEIHALCIVFI